jgi:inner membrane transporter RhtA
MQAGLALAVAAMISIQGGNVLATQLFDRIGPTATAAERMAFGALGLVLTTRVTVRGLSASDWRLVALLGVVLAGTTMAFIQSISRLPLGIAVTIAFLGPLTVSVSRSRRAIDLVWPVLALAGVALVTGAGDGDIGPDRRLGYLFALLNAMLWGSYIVVAQRAGTRIPGRLGLVLAAVIAATFSLVAGIADAGARLLDPGSLAIGATVGLVTITLAFSLEYEAMRRLPARVFGTAVSLEPAFGASFGLVFLGQSLGARQLSGVGLVVLATAGTALHRAGRPRQAN